jgi:hydrogenase/urease accessory protein HupE
MQGLGDFGSGIFHPLTTPSHVLILLGLGLLLGQQSPPRLRASILVFAPVSGAALLLTTSGLIAGVYQPLLLGVALCAAILVALERPLTPGVRNGLLAAAAVLIGLDSGVEKGSVATVIKTLLGTELSLVVVLFDLAFYVSQCTGRKWQRIGIRVVGSWIIAITLMVLAFLLKKNHAPVP